jgi:two-component system sensor histidine kinase KdpD
MADGLRAPWTALWVEGAHPLRPDDLAQVEAHLRLAESLGADVARLSGTNTADTMLRWARRRNVTRILIGKPTHSRLRDLLSGSLLERLVRESGGIDVHVISGDVLDTPPRTRMNRCVRPSGRTTSSRPNWSGSPPWWPRSRIRSSRFPTS